MKKLILMLVITGCIAFSSVKAQTINGIKLSELNSEYLEINSVRQIFGDKTYIVLDYGQQPDANNFRNLIVKDANGKNLAYGSAVDFLNQMKAHAYELFQVYTVTNSDSSTIKYVLQKKSIDTSGNKGNSDKP